MDDADRAEERIEEQLADEIERAHRAVAAPNDGVCAADDCDQPVVPGSRYCSGECLWYMERKAKSRSIAGRPVD